MIKIIILVAIALLLVHSGIQAEVPAQFSFQGILKDTSGSPVDDAIYAIKFTIYGDSITGISLWETAGFVPVQTTKGLFQHILGSTNPIPDSISRYGDLWVGIKVNLEPEMLPRTKLTSVPFSLSAQYADTATVSLDKTINAGELTLGSLDTARFSAYIDLQSENRIGNETGQLATGDHVHNGPFISGSLACLEDTSTVQVDVDQQYALLKSIHFQPDQVHDFLRIEFPISCNGSSLEYDLRIGGQSIFVNWLTYTCNPIATYCDEPMITITRLTGNQWILRAVINLNNHVQSVINFNPSPGMTLEYFVRALGPQSTTVIIGNFIAEYDVH